MDIEDTLNENNLKKYYDFTKSFHNIYNNYPDLSFNRLINLTRSQNKSFKMNVNKIILRNTFLQMVDEKLVKKDKAFLKILVKKPQRSESGIQSISILTSPYPTWKDENGRKKKQNFSCKHNCYFCPNEIDPVTRKMVMPRSYLSREPACLRASRNEFDPIKQIYDRLNTLEKMGHPLDKLEMIVLGGTVLEYPREYLTYFTTQIFYICNIYPFINSRSMLSLEEEHNINMTADIRIIGYTLETRPDGIDHESIHFLRSLGVTRMQIGIQHTNNMLLEIVNRGHTIEDSIKALKLLKDSGIKTICHLMPDLPFTTKELDIEMFNRILNDPDLLFDEGKIYPMVATDFTIVKKWADEGKYVSNADKDPNYLRDVIGHYMKNVKPWVRIPRIIRDIPNDYIHYGNKEGHLREVIDKNVKSQEIRGREIRSNKVTEYPVLIVDSFISSGATEYFIRYETRDRKYILGFCRLRLNNMIESNNPYLPELFNCAIIRELHVYGNKTVVGSKTKGVQHLGLGKKLVKNAEWIALKNGYSDICITSGIGVREYYKNKLGYHLEGMYMKKNIVYPMLIKFAFVISFIGMLIAFPFIDIR